VIDSLAITGEHRLMGGLDKNSQNWREAVFFGTFGGRYTPAYTVIFGSPSDS
jgi:hypothetical protein